MFLFALVKEGSQLNFAGIIREVTQRESSRKLVLKVELPGKSRSIEHEAQIYHRLKGVAGIPRIIASGTFKGSNAILMESVGCSCAAVISKGPAFLTKRNLRELVSQVGADIVRWSSDLISLIALTFK